jgi:alpha-beta hydrolase superfamily lysophospholipase
MTAPILSRALQALAGLLAAPAPRTEARTGPARRRGVPERRIDFRFGLTGRRWGSEGPAVLMVHGRGPLPASLRALVAPLTAAGRQVIALDAPASSGAVDELSQRVELAMAIDEAAVEIPRLEALVGHGAGAAAASVALARGLPVRRAVLMAPPAGVEVPAAVPAMVVRGEPRTVVEQEVRDFLSGRPARRGRLTLN